MRPSKLTKPVITAFRKVLEKEMNVLMCTDWDLCFLLNKQLRPAQRISYRTFQRYKQQAFIGGYMNDDDDNSDRDDFDPLYNQLFELFAEALINMKQSLMIRMLDDDKHWRRYQWVLERKFMEWNLRWSTREVTREQSHLDKVDDELTADAEDEYRERLEEKLRWEIEYRIRQEIGVEQFEKQGYAPHQQPITDEEYEEVAERQRQRDEQLNIVPPPADTEPEPNLDTEAGTEPEKPLPYWKQPGYEPDPDRLRRLR